MDVGKAGVAVSLATLLLYAAEHVLEKKFSIRWRKWIWMFFTLFLCLPLCFALLRVICSGLWIPVSLYGEWAASAHSAQAAGTFWGRTLRISSAGTLSWPVKAAAWLWPVGIAVRLWLESLQYRRFLTEVVETADPAQESWQRLFEQIKAELDMKGQVRLLCSDKIQTAMAMGIRKKVLLLPKRQYEEQALRLILTHECMHLEHQDILYKSLLGLAAAVHWYNPVIWRMKKLAFRDLEVLCDSWVVEEMDLPQRGFYGKTVLAAVAEETERDMAGTTCFFGSREILRQRLEHILDMEKKKSGYPVCAMLIVLVVLLQSAVTVEWHGSADTGRVAVELLNGTGTVDSEERAE